MATAIKQPCLHREQTPPRACSSCGAWLASFNDTDTCWPCEHSWTPDAPEVDLDMAEALGHAIDAVIPPEAFATLGELVA